MEDKIVELTKEASDMLENPLTSEDIKKLKNLLATIRCNVMFPDADSDKW